MIDWSNDLVYCESCKENHTRMAWHSIGMLCGRCNEHTGNNNQGHYWGFCKVYRDLGKEWKDCIREPHFCCPGNCELEN